MNKRNILFLFVTVMAGIVSIPPLYDLMRSAKHAEYYTHIPLTAAVAAYMIIRRRKTLFQGTASFNPQGTLLTAAGLGTYVAGFFLEFGLGNQATVHTAASLAFWWGAYILLYAKNGDRGAVFPLAFLVFIIPIPVPVMEWIIHVLVLGSTHMTRWLFASFGVPFVQEGPVFYLPGFSIEVARECSGIRSSLALFITAILAGHIFLRRFWKQAVLAAAVLPVAVFKNGVRILTIYLLSYFVDIGIIEGGFLHKSGGFIFFGMGLFMLGCLLWVLREKTA